jgi:hypothetical protein
MNLKIRNNIENKLGENSKRIDANLTGYVKNTIGVDAPILWSFIVVASPANSTVLHSLVAEEGVFLNYPNEESPLVSVVVDVVGTYEVKLVAKVPNFVERVVTNITLNNQGLIDEVTETVLVNESIDIESGILPFEYQTENNEWF